MIDSSGLGRSLQNKKFGKGEDANRNADRLGNLPDIVNSDILSLLPTKDAVSTSVLSTNWKYLWRTMTKVQIDDKRLLSSGRHRRKRADFMNFVDRVLLLLDNQVIQSFSLSCSEKYEASRVHVWISDILRRNVQKVYIIFDSCDPIGLQCSYFHLLDNDSLRELDLEVSWTFKVPTSICFSSFRILVLCTVKFLNEGFPHSSELHFRFPLLEVLDLIDCTWKEAEIVNIDAPLLNSFRVYEPVEMRDCLVKIHTASLTKFVYDGWGYGHYALMSPSSVIDASINDDSLTGYGFYSNRRTAEYTCMLMRELSCLKYLTLPFETLAVLHDHWPNQLPTCNNLIHLTIRSQIHVYGTMLVTLLRSMPILEALTFANFLPPPIFIDEMTIQEARMQKNFLDWGREEFGEVPPCLQFHLKVVKLEIIHGKKYALELVRLLLENSLVLEEMTVTACGLSPSKFEALREKVTSFTRGSEHASVNFNS